MYTRRIVWVTLVLVCVAALVGLTGCASTGPSMSDETQTGEIADIDQLLGLSDEQAIDAEADQEAIAEDDILRLLGVMEEGESNVVPPQTENTSAEATIPETQQTIPPVTNERRSQTTNQTVTSQRDNTATTTPVADRTTSADNRRTTTPSTSQRGSSFEASYQVALRDYRSRKYREAIQQFEVLLDSNTKHSLSDNSQYWIGESYYGLGNYQQAIVAFQRVFGYANSNKDDAAQLKLGLCYMRLGDNERAKMELQKLVDNYTSSEYVSLARRLIGQIQ